jgi:hypothetical protein
MSEQPGPQFEHAEFENTPSPSQCATCSRPLMGFYYEANGATVCEACRYALESQLTGGSGAGRAIRAIGAGTGAAVLGALLYYAITAVSGYEFGLIAIVVGYAVGTAVRWGSNARGGWRYQTLAIALTYLAIVATYIPPLISAIRNGADQTTTAQTSSATSAPAAPAEATPPAEPAAANTAEASGAGGLLFAVVFLMAIAIAAPFLAGFENIIGLVIIGIGLYEAWKLNKRAVLTITGPHTIAAAAGV